MSLSKLTSFRAPHLLVVGLATWLTIGCDDDEAPPYEAPRPSDAGDAARPDATDATQGDAGDAGRVDGGADAGVDGSDGGGSDVALAASRPNILLILADDLGYSDLGAFGGEIKTPNLDALARAGRLLTDHHTAATCSPTRSMLFSGTDHHLAGLGTMAEVIRPEQVGKPGYEGYLNDRSVSIAELLRDAGYHTYLSGKWHLGVGEERSPKVRGFEASFSLSGGAGSHFAPVPGKSVPADNVEYREEGKPATLPADYFSTDFFTDKLIAYIERNRADGKPFFAYAAYTAPHWPLQAPPAYLDRYAGRYDAGYDAIRDQRLARQKQLGIIPADFQPNPGRTSSPDNPTWAELTPDQRK
ncbi:MAG TPA: sulfatase-like hydrolase/transferase, partial [Polyangia bacterium]